MVSRFDEERLTLPVVTGRLALGLVGGLVATAFGLVAGAAVTQGLDADAITTPLQKLNEKDFSDGHAIWLITGVLGMAFCAFGFKARYNAAAALVIAGVMTWAGMQACADRPRESALFRAPMILATNTP